MQNQCITSTSAGNSNYSFAEVITDGVSAYFDPQVQAIRVLL